MRKGIQLAQAAFSCSVIDCACCSWTIAESASAVKKQLVLEGFEVLGEWLDKNRTRPWTTGSTVEKDR